MLNVIDYIPREKVKKAVIFLHGYGSNGHDFSSLIFEFSKHLKNTAFFSPNAPTPLNFNFGEAYEWFSLDNYNPEQLKMNFDQMKYVFSEYTALADSSRLKINELIDFIKKSYKIEAKDIAILGFSQGGLMSLLTSLLYKEELGPVISFSGIAPVLPASSKVNKLKDVLLIHGSDDDVVPINSIKLSEKQFSEFDIKPEIFISDGMGHEINFESQKKAISFLKENFC